MENRTNPAPWRIEAAWKRQMSQSWHHREMEELIAKHEKEIAELKKQTGNAAALREALVQCELFLGNVSRHGHPTLNPGDKCTACNGADELRGMVVRALSAPPRNCEVGTAEEQIKRFAQYCDSKVCNRRDCACGYEELFRHKCAIRWAQTPYAEKGDGDGE